MQFFCLFIVTLLPLGGTNESGYSLFSKRPIDRLLREKSQTINEDLRKLVVDKATQFFYRYRPLNTFYYTGGRNKFYRYLDFLPARRNFDLMVANRDKVIHQTCFYRNSDPA